MNITKQHIELFKEIENFRVYAEKYLKIKDKNGEIVPLVLNKAQLVVLSKIEEQIKAGVPIRLIILKARQKGISTLIEAYIFWRTSNWHQRKSAIVGHKVDATNNLYAMTKRYLKYLPHVLQPQIEASNEKVLRYGKLESEIKLYTAESGDVGSSDTIQDLHLTEVAKWRDPKTSLTALLQTVPDKPNTMVVLETTAKGIGGEFYDRWQMAKNGESNYIPIFLSWLIDDEYTLKFRDQEDKDKLINSIDEIEEGLLASGATLEHLNWRRKIGLPDKCGNDVDQFRQEYPCLPGDVLIQTANGLDRIEEAFVDGNMILNKYNQGETQCYLLKTKLGYEIEATENHQFLTRDGWFSKLKDLKVGDKIQLGKYDFGQVGQIVKYNPVSFVESFIHITEELALFIGMYMGDGDFGDNAVGMACDKECDDFVDKVKEIYTKLFSGYSERFTGTKKGCYYLTKSNKKFKEIFDKLELIQPKRLKNNGWSNGWKRWVHIPSYIFNSPKEVVKAFLQGLFETDGFVDRNGNRVVLFSKHKEFLKQVQILLLGFGITSKFTGVEKIAGNGSIYIGYELNLRKEESIKFAEEIGFLSEKKIKRLEGSISREKVNGNAIPLIMEDEIILIEPSDIKTVYDVETPSHEVIANGFITHNSNDIEAFIASGSPVFDANKCYINFTEASRFNPLVGNLEGNDKEVVFRQSERGYIKIFDEKILKDVKDDEMYRFANGADVAEGLAQGDYSVNATWDRLKNQVCMTWRGHIDPDLFAEELFKIQLFQKKKGFFAVEKNNHGHTVIKSAYKRGVSLYHNQTFEKGYPSDTGTIGFLTTSKSKPEIINDLNEWIREGILISKDKQFWSEALRFVRNDKGGMSAQGKDQDVTLKSFDDTVIAYALMIRCSLWLPNYFIKPEPEIVSRPYILEMEYQTVDEATF